MAKEASTKDIYIGSLGVELVVKPFAMQNWVCPIWINVECSVFKAPHQNKSCTSRKYGKKEPQSFSHCGAFDHHALQPLNNCKYVFLVLPIDTLDSLGLIIYRWKGLENTFPTVYHTPQEI